MIFRKIEQDNCFIIQQIVNKTLFVVRKTVVVRCFARFRTNLGNLCISQDICYVWMTDNNGFLTIYGHHANLLNNNKQLSGEVFVISGIITVEASVINLDYSEYHKKRF